MTQYTPPDKPAETDETKARTADLSVSLLRRCGAIFYDWIVIAAILLLWTAAWVMAGVTFGHPLYFAYNISVYLIIFAYFTLFWRYNRRTIGMTVWKIELLGYKRAIDWPMAITRFAIANISTALFGLGFLWSLFSSRNDAWHDYFSDSCLRRLSPLPAQPKTPHTEQKK